MRIFCYIALTLAFFLTAFPGTATAYKVYLKSDGSMEVESHRVEGDKVYLKLPGGEVEFDKDRVDLEKTESELKAYKEKLAKAAALMDGGDPEAASDVYAGMIDPDTSDVELLRLAGTAYTAAGRYDKAADVFKRIQETDPDAPGIRTSLGDVYYGEGKYYDAIDQYLIALDEDPADKRAHLGLGMTYAKQEMYVGAKTELNKAVEIYPKYAEAYATLGYVYYKMSDFKNAEKMLKAAVDINSRLPEAHYYMGLLYGVLGNQSRDSTERMNYIDKSIDSFRKAVTLRRFYPEAHADLGVAYYSRGSVARAIEEFNMALTQKPDMAVTHSNLAGIYNHRGFYKEAVAEAQTAVSIDPHLVDAYMIMGNAYANMRNYLEAAKAYDNYLYYAPSGPLADEAAQRLKWVIQEGGLTWPPEDAPGPEPSGGGV